MHFDGTRMHLRQIINNVPVNRVNQPEQYDQDQNAKTNRCSGHCAALLVSYKVAKRNFE